jgi:hypothetical protein
MTIESEIADLTTSTTALLTAVGNQQISVNDAIAAFAIITNKVNTELNLVNNTADLDKPINNLTTAELNTKQETLVSGTNISTINGLSILNGTPLVIARGQVEKPVLSYANIGTLRTPVSPVPLTGDIVNVHHLGEFQYSSSFDYLDDGETVFEAVDPSDGVTPIGQWVLALPAYEWTQSQKLFEKALMWEHLEDVEREELNN